MAHECPDCYMPCHCGGDIDDIEFERLPPGGCHCDCYKETDELDEFDEAVNQAAPTTGDET